MIITFYLHDVVTGELVEGIVPFISVITRRSSVGAITDLSDDVEEPVEAEGGLYSLEISDDLVLPGSIIDCEIDCTDQTVERRLAYHRSSADLTSSIQVASSSVDFSIKRGALAPAFERVLRDERGRPLDLSGEDVEVTFRMRPIGGGPLKIDAAAQVVGDGKKGRARYVFEGTDTNLVGLFDAEFVTDEGDDEESVPRIFPSSGYYSIEVVATLAD